jgi:hypothetical protein
MQLDESPVFRKLIIPWYDSEPVCLVTLMFLDIVLLFGAAGVSAALEHPEYYEHIWVPILLIVTSGIAIISMTLRLVKRFSHYVKYSESMRNSNHPVRSDRL